MGTDIVILFQVFDEASEMWLTVKKNVNNYILCKNSELPIFPLLDPKDPDDDFYYNMIEEYGDKVGDFTYQFHISRDYIFFAKIANVRNEHNLMQVFQPKGLPDDVPLQIRDMFRENDNHTWFLDSEVDTINTTELPNLPRFNAYNWPGLNSLKEHFRVVHDLFNRPTRALIGFSY